jgi:hypothetical protein
MSFRSWSVSVFGTHCTGWPKKKYKLQFKNRLVPSAVWIFAMGSQNFYFGGNQEKCLPWRIKLNFCLGEPSEIFNFRDHAIFYLEGPREIFYLEDQLSFLPWRIRSIFLLWELTQFFASRDQEEFFAIPW